MCDCNNRIHITVTGPVTVNNIDYDRITRTVTAALAHTEGDIMSQLDDRLADLQAAETTNSAKLATLIQDFESAGTLTQAQTDALDALKNEVVGNSANIDAADPNAVVVSPPPAA